MGGGKILDGFGVQDAFIPKLVGFLLHLTCIIIGQDLLELLHSSVGFAILQHFKNVKLAGSKNGSYCFHNTFNLRKNNYLTQRKQILKQKEEKQEQNHSRDLLSGSIIFLSP